MYIYIYIYMYITLSLITFHVTSRHISRRPSALAPGGAPREAAGAGPVKPLCCVMLCYTVPIIMLLMLLVV